MQGFDLSIKLLLSVMHYPSHRLSKFGQIEYETVRGPYLSGSLHYTHVGSSISKQSGPWSGSSYKGCLIWVCSVCNSV